MRTSRLLAGAVVLALITAVLGIASSAPAQAAPESPTGLTPNGTNVSGTPVLAWDRAAGVTGYEVEVFADADYSDLLFSSATKNSQIAPKVPLTTTVHWRLRAVDADGPGEWAEASFTTDPAAPPTPVGPADGAQIQPPNDTALLRWAPVAGVTEYVVQVGSDDLFTDPELYEQHTTAATSMVVTPTRTGDHYWRVQAIRGETSTGWSDARSFVAHGLRPVDADTAVPNHTSPAEYVEDAVLDWDPVPGAVTYELRIDDDIDFNSLLVSESGIVGTRYARPATLDNDEYYWQVRAVDSQGVTAPWDQVPTFTFRRAWPDQPRLEHPAAGATVGDPLYFEWAPSQPDAEKDVRLASSYVLELSTDPSFADEGNIQRCTTVHTTYVPSRDDDCWPSHGGLWWWRVQGRDGTSGPVTDLIGAEKRSFTYRPWVVPTETYSPANGYTGPPPTLSWEAVDGAAKYEVTITRESTGSTTIDTTATTQYSPRGILMPKPGVAESYTWQVRPLTGDGREGNGILASGRPRFTVTSSGYGDAVTPEPTAPADGSSHPRFPTLRWTPLAGADTPTLTRPPLYRVYIRPVGAAVWEQLPETTRQASLQDTDTTYLTPGTTYEWRVEAYSHAGGLLATSATTRTFRIQPLDDATGQRVSLTGSAADGESCDASLPVRCTELTETPVLSWNPVPDAGYYRLWISYDREHTNPFRTIVIDATRYRPNDAFPDSQAGTAYYWHVQPCVARNSSTDHHCNPLDYAAHAFEKKSDPVELVGVASAPCGSAGPVCDDVTLSWRDYVDTHELIASVSTKAEIEADKYRVQVATNADFTAASIVDTAVVDQREYTADEETYPEGDLWWRVQAVDGSGNNLPWSTAAKFTKRSPVPTLVSPVGGLAGNGAQFTWDPLAFAAAYDLEVYENGDTNANLSNRVVVKAGIRRSALTLTEPLPVADQPYVWRVRRVDASGRKGAWSPWSSFAVAGALPQYASPANGVTMPPNDALFTWTAPDTLAVQPAAYRFQRRKVNTTSLTENVITTATAWAPTATITDGEWEWRVVALDTVGSEIGATGEPWRRFTAHGKPLAVQKPIISGSGEVGSVLTVQSPVWQPADVVESWQWFRGSTAIAGETDDSYQLQPEDLGRAIKVRVTASKPGYQDGTVDSDQLAVVAGGAPQAAPAVQIEGSGKVNTTLTSSPASWNVDVDSESYQWFRGDAKISRATQAEYVVKPTDVGHTLTLQVTAERDGYADGLSISNGIVGVDGDALVATVKPSISGTGAVGSTLRSSRGQWSPTPDDYDYQWLRNGAPIAGADSSTYRLVPADATKAITLRVIASEPGYAEGDATTNVIRVRKMTSTSSVKASSYSVRPRKRFKVTVTVSVPSPAVATGPFQIFAKPAKGRQKLLAKGSLTASARGVKTVRVRLTKQSSYTLKVVYRGTGSISPSTDTTPVTVRR